MCELLIVSSTNLLLIEVAEFANRLLLTVKLKWKLHGDIVTLRGKTFVYEDINKININRCVIKTCKLYEASQNHIILSGLMFRYACF